MPRYVAFLRAVNVGGRTVKMDALRRLFEALGYAEVATFIASGNVIFEAKSNNAAALERQIEKKLREALGYEVETFVRTGAELAAITSYQPFPPASLGPDTVVYVLFLGRELDAAAEKRVLALSEGLNTFHVHGREVYWLRRRQPGVYDYSTALLEKALDRPFTARGAKTVQKMAAKYLSGEP